MRGIAYQQDLSGGGGEQDVSVSTEYNDPLANPSTCERDIPYLQELRTNIIRVYAIDPEEDHDECMTMLANAGIYVIADLSQPGQSINRDSPSWDDDLYARYTAVVDTMAPYTNTMGFFAGNEVSNQPNNTHASAFVKAAVRDTKAYIRSQDYRPIGVGYATNDDAEIRDAMADYFNCGDREDTIDFWGYNIYSWCGESSFTESGYDQRTEEFEDYSVPVFFAEYGCNEVDPREFGDVPALYGPQMNDVWSGGIVYMYFQEDNDYGKLTPHYSLVLPDLTTLQVLSPWTVTTSGLLVTSKASRARCKRSLPPVSKCPITRPPTPPDPAPRLAAIGCPGPLPFLRPRTGSFVNACTTRLPV